MNNKIVIKNREPQQITINGGGEVIGITTVLVNGIDVTEGSVAYVIVPTKTSELINDSGFLTQETDPTIPYYIKQITQGDINRWNNKQEQLVSGVNIKTVNDNSLLGSGNIDISTSYSAGYGININASNEISNTITSYNDLTDLPTIPTSTSDLINDSDYVTSNELSDVAFSGSYADLSNIPEIPDSTSELINDSGFIDMNLLWNLFPKSTGSGTSINLSDTVKNTPLYLTLGATELSQDATPTPSSPQDIHTISGSNTIKVFGNIYDYTDLKQSYAWLTYDEDGWYTATINNTSSSGSYYNFTTNFSNLLETDTAYSIITEVKSITTSGSGGTINSWDRWGQFSTGISTGYSAVGTYVGTATTKSDFTSVSQMLASSIYVRANSSITATFRISVLKGTNITASNFVYQPYTSQEADIDLGAKNLFNKYTINNVFNGTNNNGTITTITGNNELINLITYFTNITVKSGDTIYLSADIKLNNNSTGSLNNINDGINAGTTFILKPTLSTKYQRYQVSYTYSGDTTISRLLIQLTGVTGTAEVTNIQISKDKSAGYTEYGIEPIEYCKIGTYADEFIRSNDGTWQLKKNIGKVVLDGSEADWTLNNSGTPNYSYRISIAGQLITGNGISNLYPYVSAIYDGNTSEGFALSNASTTYLQIRVRYGTEQTLSDFKTFLGTNNLIVYYVLATPTYTQITGTLAEQLETIYKELTPESEQTNISQTNADLPFTITATTLKSIANI